jgi:tetratricopeptide (TPR) repeat protein
MPLITAATIIGINDFVFSNLKSYFAKKFIEKQIARLDDKQEFALRRVINETLDEYAAKFPVESTRTTFPFYHSQKIVNELLSYRIMHGDDYNIEQLTQAFEAEPNVIPPTAQNLADFFGIFTAKVKAARNLKKLEIKETFQEEVFLISREIDALKQYIENMFAGFDADLQLQWKDRIETYVSTLQAFKPQTALNLLDALMKSLDAGTTKPSAQFRASIEYQKGICHRLLTQKTEACKAYIKAHELDPANGIYEEQAALAYHRIEEYTKAIALADQIIARDQFNAMGWAVRVINSGAQELPNLLGQVPAIVKKDIVFQMIVYSGLNTPDAQTQLKMIDQLGIVPSYRDYVAKPVTVNNIWEHNFWLTVMVNGYFQGFYFEFQTVHSEAKKDLVAALNDLLKRYFEAITGTEIPDEELSLRFMYAFTNYILSEDVKFALEMKVRYEGLKNKPVPFLLITANVLQNAGEVPGAIEVIEASAHNGPEVLMLLAFCYMRNHEPEKYAATVKLITQAYQAVPHAVLYIYTNHIIDLKMSGTAGELTVSDFVDGKQFETPHDRETVEKIAQAMLVGITPEITAGLLELSNGTHDPRALGQIATALHLAGQHKEALTIFDRFLDKTEESRDLYHYIRALHKIKRNHKDLLELLEHWRLNCWFDPWASRAELQVYKELNDWSRCITIAEHHLAHEPDDEHILAHYIFALHESGDKLSQGKLSVLVVKLRDFNYMVPEHARLAANILIKQKHFTEALDLLYRYAIDENNKPLRTAYFMAFTECKPPEEHLWPINEYESVAAGHFVKYKLNGQVKFVELNELNLKNPFYQKLIGRQKGEIYTVERPMIKEEDTVIVERIMDKYLSLHDQILEEVHDNPYSGIPLQSFTIDPDNVVESMHSLLQKMVGESGSRERDRVKEELTQYYNYQRSFSDVIVRVYREDYLAGYLDLARHKGGINMLPITNFNHMASAQAYALDLSSLPIIYQMFFRHGTTYPDKFIISKYIVDVLKKQLLEAKESSGEQLSLSVTLEEVRPSMIPENAQENNVKYLTGLLQWIEENCLVKITERVLDFTRNIELEDERKEFMKYFLNTSLLLEETQGLKLITDDVLYYSLGVAPQRIVSSEYFAKQVLPEDAPALEEFIKNKYRGFSPSMEQVNQEYIKKTAGQIEFYAHCLENLSLLNNPSNARVALEHIKWLVLNSLAVQQQLELEVINVFTSLLKGVSMPGLQQNFQALINEKFKLLGTKKDMVLSCLNDAFGITGQ